MKALGISISLFLISISFVDMCILLWQSKEYDDITNLTKEFVKPFIIFLVAFYFLMNTLVMKKSIYFLLPTVTFGLIGIGYFGGIFFLATSSDVVISNIINKARLLPINSIFSIPHSYYSINEENARTHILSFCLAMSLTMFSMASSACNLMLKNMDFQKNTSQQTSSA